MNRIFEIVRTAFNSLWKMRMRGDTLEIITPFATTNDKFVSIFVSIRKNGYVVNDGGWLANGFYDCDLPLLNDIYIRVLNYYMAEYKVKCVDASPNIFYYKITTEERLVPNLVFDLAAFIKEAVSSSFINYEDNKEIEVSKRFSGLANSFFRELIPSQYLKINHYVSENLRGIRFNTVLSLHNRYTLISYVTGSRDNYYILSLSKANTQYDFIESDAINRLVSKKIVLLDDTVKSYSSEKVVPFMKVILSKTDRDNVTWKERNRLKELVSID